MPPVIITAPVKVFETHCEVPIPFRQGLEYFDSGRDDFATDPVTGNCCNCVSFHRIHSQATGTTRPRQPLVGLSRLPGSKDHFRKKKQWLFPCLLSWLCRRHRV